MKAKMRFAKMKMEAYADDTLNLENEQDVMTVASPMKMWIGVKKLGDFSLIVTSFCLLSVARLRSRSRARTRCRGRWDCS